MPIQKFRMINRNHVVICVVALSLITRRASHLMANNQLKLHVLNRMNTLHLFA
jgi:hypothetical protein